MANKKMSVTNIPQMVPPLTTAQLVAQATLTTGYDGPSLSHSSSSFLDPAEQVLLKASESKVRRKKEETRLELEKIQERIDCTLSEYHGPESAKDEASDAQEVDFHAVKSPEELYKLLTDVRLRAKYQQQVTVLLLGHETALEDRERLLHSVHEFFQETQAGNTVQLLEELESEELDFEEATAGLESALRTAQSAGERLLEIKKDMGQLFAIVQAFPDTKKGRKKLEKALLKAQEEVESLNTQLQRVQKELEGSKEKGNRLQKQIDSKMTECERLRKTAAEAEQLKKTNAGLLSEVAKAKEDVQKAVAESERERQERLRLLAKTDVVREGVQSGSDGKVQELEVALENERKAVEELRAKIEAREGEVLEEREALVAEHEAEVQDMRSRYEDQMKSLMEDDLFSDAGSVGEGGGEEVDFEAREPQMDGLGSEGSAEHLKLEHQQREKKLRDELNDVKNKSRKTITALKVQLTETQNRLSDESNSLQKQIDNLDREKASISAESEEKNEQVASLRAANSSLEARLTEAATREEETAAKLIQLQRDLEEALATKLDEVGPEKASRLLELANRSARWSEVSPQSGHLTPSKQLPTAPPFPILPMDEVLHSCEPSTSQFHPHSFPGGRTLQSIQPGGTPCSEEIHLPGGTPISPTSLDRSVTSYDHHLSSPQHEAAHHPLHMLAQSRLSHHSAQMAGTLSHDHPVVCEWVKAYNLVMKFRDGVVEMLCDDERFETEVEDLRSIEGAPMERDQEVQGQVTQMRFSLTLMLHQMEVTLQESFSKLLEGGGEGGDKEEGEDGEVRNLKLAQAQLRRKLKQAEDTHQTELQESKETIANLSNKVETLRMEIASLRHSMNTPMANELGEPPLAMFTRLDYDHNTRELQSALNTEQLSPTVYRKVNDDMSKYLTIPSQRLVHIGKRSREKELAEKLVCNVRHEYRDRGDVAERVVGKIRSREEQQQRRFEKKMDELRVKRTSLARTLTSQLGEMETDMNVILIKPIYGSIGRSQHQDLITPLPRPVPNRTPQPPRSQSWSRVVSAMGRRGRGRAEEGGTEGGGARSVRLVTTRQEAHRGDTVTAESERVSCHATPLPPRQPVTTLAGHGRREQKIEGEGAWQVELSRPPTQLDSPFSPLMFHAPPAVPRILELDINKKRKRCVHTRHMADLLGSRHPADLLGHLLPGREFKSTTPTPAPPTQHSATLQSKLVVHSNKPIPSGTPSSHSHSLSFPHPPTLPPISVPSRINGPITAA